MYKKLINISVTWLLLAQLIPGQAEVCLNDNAIWIDNRWAAAGASEAKLRSLFDRIAKLGITDIYLEVGTFKKDGSLLGTSPTLSLPEPIVFFKKAVCDFNQLRKTRLNLLAWLKADGSNIDLTKERTRREIIFAVEYLIGSGFRGVIYDIHPNPKPPGAFLALLEESRKTIGWSRALAVRASAWGAEYDRWHWDSEFYQSASKPVSYLEVCLFDSRTTDKSEYYEWIENSLVNITQSIPVAKQDVLRLSLPAHNDKSDESATHRVIVENLETSLAGVRRALPDIRIRKKAISGFSVFSEQDMNEKEWGLVERFLKPEFPPPTSLYELRRTSPWE